MPFPKTVTSRAALMWVVAWLIVCACLQLRGEKGQRTSNGDAGVYVSPPFHCRLSSTEIPSKSAVCWYPLDKFVPFWYTTEVTKSLWVKWEGSIARTLKMSLIYSKIARYGTDGISFSLFYHSNGTRVILNSDHSTEWSEWVFFLIKWVSE